MNGSNLSTHMYPICGQAQTGIGALISFFLTLYRFIKAVLRSWNDKNFRAALVLASAILLSGALFYHSVEGWSWTDSLYFSVTTISTVGLGDLSPQTQIGKLFTVLYIFVGVGVFVAVFTQFARALLDSEINMPSAASTSSTKPDSVNRPSSNR
ncbi:potassium channel family protein [Pseudophaeobacter sp. MA21411-1]|nr:potassium channel family protein [Pseudophaeobacter flagellatus]